MAYQKYEYEHSVTTSEIDFKGEIKPSTILNLFQEAAGCNSQEMGTGLEDLRARGMFWVLSKMYVEFKQFARHKDIIKVSTWAHKPNKAIFERSFSVTLNGGVCANAISRWCILDIDTGRILPAALAASKPEELLSERAVECCDWHISDIENGDVADFEIKIAHSEYDLNYHVNNVKYADYIFNCFSIEELKSRQVKSLQINYIKQSHEKDVLRFFRKKISDSEFIVKGIKNDEETVVTARVCFY